MPTPELPEIPPDPVVAAAKQLVADLFRQVSSQLPDLLRNQTPSDDPIPKHGDEMIKQLQAQLDRALGEPSKPGGPQLLMAASGPQAAFDQEVRRQMDLALAALSAPDKAG